MATRNRTAVLLALLLSSTGFAANVTIVPSTLDPVNPGDTFTVTVQASGMPDVRAFAVALSYDTNVVTVPAPSTTSIVQNPACPNCTFTNGLIVASPFVSGGEVQGQAGFDPPIPSGSFNAFQVTFTVNPLAAAGALANIVFADGGAGWTDANTFETVPVTYTQANVVVAGGAAAPNIAVTDSVPPAVDLLVPFGSVTLGTTSTRAVTVTNSGTADLAIGQVAGLAAPFSLGTDACSYQILAPAASCNINIEFAPVLAGASNSSLTIPSNDPDTATENVTVTGTGIQLPNAADDGPIAVIEGVTKVIPVGANDTGFTNPVTLRLTALPTKGTISAFSPPGPAAGMTITYTANIGAVGADSFGYDMTDTTPFTDAATVTLTIGPDSDGDGVPDLGDNCKLASNTLAGNVPGTSPPIPKSQLDSDHDGYGNRCDGDLTNDGLVNTTDYSIFRSLINQSAAAFPLAAVADLNGSGKVDTVDWAIFRTLINKAPGPSGLVCAGTIPCP